MASSESETSARPIKPERQPRTKSISIQSHPRHETAYDILGLSPTSKLTTDDIRHAYKSRLLESHPDKREGSRAAFDALHNAYKQLCDDRTGIKKQSSPPPTVIVDTVFLNDDMDICADGDDGNEIACYPCRCGDDFVIPLCDIISSSTVVTCHGCSLSIVVIDDSKL